MKTVLPLILLTFISGSALADYTANITGKIIWIKTYNSGVIFFGLSPMPSDHKCSGTFFAIDPALDSDIKNRYYSMLLTAKSSDVNVSVGYDNVNANCLLNRPIIEALSF